MDVKIAVCLKWTARHGIGDDDGSTAAGGPDARFAGTSESDRAALEVALRMADALGATVTAVTAGPAGADAALRDAVACGASRAVRIDLASAITSEEVAARLAEHVTESLVVVCGDVSADRGSGSVPAFIAHRLQRAQALGLVALELRGGSSPTIDAVRRLDGGRREVLRIPMPCVVSVEGSVASLRRASLRAALAARHAPIEVVSDAGGHIANEIAAVVSPYRPRARALAAPTGVDALARVRALTDTSGSITHGETVHLDPRSSALRIITALREWGYLSPPSETS